MGVPDPRWSWTAAPVWRAHMAARDVGRLLGGLAATARAALRGSDLAPCVAVLEAPAHARQGALAACRVRIHNPGSTACTITTRVRGARRDLPRAAFDLRWTHELAAGAAAERWLVTDWLGTAALHDAPPPPTIVLCAPSVRWTIEATVENTPNLLRIEGALGE